MNDDRSHADGVREALAVSSKALRGGLRLDLACRAIVDLLPLLGPVPLDISIGFKAVDSELHNVTTHSSWPVEESVMLERVRRRDNYVASVRESLLSDFRALVDYLRKCAPS